MNKTHRNIIKRRGFVLTRLQKQIQQIPRDIFKEVKEHNGPAYQPMALKGLIDGLSASKRGKLFWRLHDYSCGHLDELNGNFYDVKIVMLKYFGRLIPENRVTLPSGG